jgi:hypothetical protein
VLPTGASLCSMCPTTSGRGRRYLLSNGIGTPCCPWASPWKGTSKCQLPGCVMGLSLPPGLGVSMFCVSGEGRGTPDHQIGRASRDAALTVRLPE